MGGAKEVVRDVGSTLVFVDFFLQTCVRADGDGDNSLCVCNPCACSAVQWVVFFVCVESRFFKGSFMCISIVMVVVIVIVV